ncbi:MAG TPA: bifunctional proline dehydrogenase/L-glutamate gamma-semialdehyde dehydrogenase PutA, partial [Woeseiaceae bacterium]|nr:bifunctional proline dehydrogenase/L-glutamate gamma-semialdehyde dehydrogenase PutA [Woeseiaceae bacterium]
MKFTEQTSVSTDPLGAISERYLADEARLVAELARQADAGDAARVQVREIATGMVAAVRRNAAHEGGIDAFLQQYDLSSEEGVLLMCIAEALLRIPDADTADRLIADKVTSARWKDHLGASDSLFVNASTWGLMLTGELLRVDESAKRNPAHYLGKIAARAGEPVVRGAMRQAMRIMGHQFVMGRSIGEALGRAARGEASRYRHSFDMLGEAALTADDAGRYFEAYANAIRKIGDSSAAQDVFDAPGISVKLSALHPRYQYTQYRRVLAELVPVLSDLALQAKAAGIGLTVDAEESDRLEISLEVFEAVYRDKRLHGYEGFGLAVQAYQRRALDVLRFVSGLAAEHGRRVPLRLVKGAYWDTEIKRAQELGLPSYPVFTRKAHTDVSYLACARAMLAAGNSLYPQFATHNAHTLASILHFAGARRDFEFQRLHGMGEELYEEVINPQKYNRPCRVYAPVGSHKDLLPYLVRRLLENGANTSFVNRIVDESIAVEEIVRDPIRVALDGDCRPHPRIPAPGDLFGRARRNSAGYNLADRRAGGGLLAAMQAAAVSGREAGPIVGGRRAEGGAARESRNPANTAQLVGICRDARRADVERALDLASGAQRAWNALGAAARATVLERAAGLYEQHTAELLALCVREAGKTVPDAIAELREAVDFLRYYAVEARRLYGAPVELPGPTG